MYVCIYMHKCMYVGMYVYVGVLSCGEGFPLNINDVSFNWPFHLKIAILIDHY